MNKHNKKNKLQIRNSTAEFLIFAYQSKGDGIEVRVQDGTIWLTQKNMSSLFDSSIDNVALHIKNIYTDGELDENSTTEDFSVVQQEGNREVRRTIKHYNLDVIIAVGYRVNSKRATAFRQWATGILRDFTLRGYVIDRKRMENGTFLDDDYFERLLEEIREIRLSERRFYQKITDIYATSMDYSPESSTTKDFFARVQNKMHYAVHKQTAAELIIHRADHTKENMGLTSWGKSPHGKIVKTDVTIAKNYLTESELESLGRIVNGYLDFAEEYAKRRKPLTMSDWAKHLDLILQANGNDLLQDAGKITAAIAKQHAENEFESYRSIQDRLFESDFDKEIKRIKGEVD
ncbi:cell filamentation protein Fic [Bacteroides sp. 214]|uniref:virulence RhuM family protein n=1 Tax=Bacteroides sp. 214 TaxID=2302935 RepID=UPI0013D6885A|nr:virulence RhuM family protein [Bacteroides sp. 214]NDW13160.1 cell filamentation protein Fic [Bacteroides sp. 214]